MRGLRLTDDSNLWEKSVCKSVFVVVVVDEKREAHHRSFYTAPSRLLRYRLFFARWWA